MSRRRRDALEPELEDVNRLDVPDWSEPLARVATNPFVQLGDLLVRQAGVGLRNWNQLSLVPDAERVVGQQACAPAAAGLRVDEYGIDGVRIDLPFPPVAAPAADAIR